MLLSGLFIALVASPVLAQPQVILDYRSPSPSRPTPNLSTQVTRQVLSQVVKKTDKACLGQLQPKVIDLKRGSFTGAKVSEAVYLVDLGDACHPRNTGTKRLALFRGDRLITYTDATNYNTIKKLVDVDKNGQSEVLLEGGWMSQGYFAMYAKIVGFRQRQPLTLKEFRDVYTDNFGAVTSGLSQKAAVISVTQTQGKVEFKRENYTASCSSVKLDRTEPKCASYQLTSTGDRPE